MSLPWLRRLLRRHPYLSNAAFYGTMFVGAEVTQQLFIRKRMVKQCQERPPLDRAAVGRYAVMGYAVAPSILYPWYKWLDARYVGTALSVISKKIFLDVLILGPIEVLIFFTCMNLMEGKNDVSDELRSKYVPTVVKEVYFWAPVQLFNFLFLPAGARVAFVGVSSFIWLSILCWVKRSPSTSTTSGVLSTSTTSGVLSTSTSGGGPVCHSQIS